jgi:hypothetical protein
MRDFERDRAIFLVFSLSLIAIFIGVGIYGMSNPPEKTEITNEDVRRVKRACAALEGKE